MTLNFNVGPSIVDPSITRFSNEKSRQDCVCVTPAIVAHFPTEILVKTMVQFPDIRELGDEVGQRKSSPPCRSRALAALPAAKRLELFRTQFDDLESLVPRSLHRKLSRHNASERKPLRSRIKNKIRPSLRANTEQAAQQPFPTGEFQPQNFPASGHRSYGTTVTSAGPVINNKRAFANCTKINEAFPARRWPARSEPMDRGVNAACGDRVTATLRIIFAGRKAVRFRPRDQRPLVRTSFRTRPHKRTARPNRTRVRCWRVPVIQRN